MKRWPTIGLSLAVLWLFVRGVALEPRVIVGEFIIGLFVGVPLAFFTRRFYTETVPVIAVFRAVPYIAAYLVLFGTELIKANINVAYRVLAPSMPIEPRVIELPLRVESDLAITTIANSITLTPGTLSMDYDDERNSLYVHAIAGANREAIVAPIRAWEDYALRIFDEERGPSSKVPHPPKDHAFDGGKRDGE
ncbi:cation transporter [Halobacteriales archaeon QS_4_62_28]|nr:MAG: cation transporter [Halobacteriales archaeon QS_4_62_28]